MEMDKRQIRINGIYLIIIFFQKESDSDLQSKMHVLIISKVLYVMESELINAKICFECFRQKMSFSNFPER